jgi:hypothetical protein
MRSLDNFEITLVKNSTHNAVLALIAEGSFEKVLNVIWQ